MSEHLPPRSSVGSRESSDHQQHVPSYPRPHGDPDPLASVWIRRLHLTPTPPPHSGLAPPQPPPMHENDAVSNRSAGFGPFRWSPRPQRDAAPCAGPPMMSPFFRSYPQPVPAGAWDAAPAPCAGPPMMSPFFRSYLPQPVPVVAWDAAPAPAPCASPPMMSPFFRSEPQPMPAVADAREFAPVRTAIGFGSIACGGGGFAGLSSRAILDVNPHASWLATPAAAGSAYPNHAVDMVPIRASHDIHVRQHGMIPRSVPRPAPSPSSQNDEPFSYWNMGRFQKSTTTSSISQVAVAPGNFVKKRYADSNGFVPLKFRKLSGA